MNTRETEVHDEHEAVDPHAGRVFADSPAQLDYAATGGDPTAINRDGSPVGFPDGLRLKIWRLSNLKPGTQADLAKELDVSEWSVSGWENGKRSPSPRNRAAIKRVTKIDWGTP